MDSVNLLQAMFSFKSFLALGGAIVAWLTVVNTVRDDMNKDILLKQTSQASQAAVQEQPDYVQSLKRMTPPQLREAVADFGRDLRLFQNESIDATLQVTDKFQNSSRGLSPEDPAVRAAWERMNAEQRERSRVFNYRFETELRPKALAIREEIARRTGVPIAKPGTDHRSHSLDFGGLAGAFPATELAEYLEELARKI